MEESHGKRPSPIKTRSIVPASSRSHERRIERLEHTVERLKHAVAELVVASTHLLAVLLTVVKATGVDSVDKEAADALAKLQRVIHQAEKEIS